MKTMVSVLGTILLMGAVAVAQGSGSSGASSTKKASTSSSAGSVQAGNSGFDASESAQSSPSTTASSSQSGSSHNSSASDTPTAASSQYGSSSSQSIANGPVAETVSDSSALIGWATRDSASNTGVKYGTNRANMTETAQGTDGADGKNHHVRLQGLSASTRYYFQITENGQPVGGVGTFKTTASGETPVQSKAVIPQK